MHVHVVRVLQESSKSLCVLSNSLLHVLPLLSVNETCIKNHMKSLYAKTDIKYCIFEMLLIKAAEIEMI